MRLSERVKEISVIQRNLIEKVAPTDAQSTYYGFLMVREKGNWLAQHWIHEKRVREIENPMIEVNCAAMPIPEVDPKVSFLDMFRGLFTFRPSRIRAVKFEAANSVRTIFLDEIGRYEPVGTGKSSSCTPRKLK